MQNVPVPNVETILQGLTKDLRERRSGYRLTVGFRRFEEETDTLRTVNLTVFVLEDGAKVGALQTDVRVKLLSDPSPEQQTVSGWRIGTLEDAARMVCAGLEEHRE